ncbi:MAG: Tfp pilus assembly protein FimT/FimU [Planctomycetota bacterium]
MKRRGFSLLELLVVIGLIVALSAIAVPSVVDLFQGRALVQAYNIIDGAFQEARSKAISTREETAVIFSYRSDNNSPSVKLWIVGGGLVDADPSGPLKGMKIDERDLSAAAYDDVILGTQILPPTVSLSGLANSTQGSQSALMGTDGYYTRWYVVFRPDGTALMIKPDGDVGMDHTDAGYLNVNDYLPIPEYQGVAPAAAADTDITSYKVLPDEFESDPSVYYDLRLSDSQEDIYMHLQPSTGKLVKRSSGEK